MTSNTVLVLGANGRFGAAATTAFADAGWQVLAQVRRSTAVLHPRVRPLHIGLADTDALVAAAAGARAVVHAINPVYTRWAAEVQPHARHGMDVAERLGATFMLPGNVYNFGAGMPDRLLPDTPEAATSRKGHTRVALEAEMRQRAAHGLASVVIRAGDFYGCGAGSWFDQVIVKSLAAGKLVCPGALDVPHAWAYVPDLARAFVAVATRGTGRGFTSLHFAGHTLTGAQLLAAIEAARGGAPMKHGTLPWPLIRAGGLIVPMWRELAEMAYLWRVPHALDGSALAAVAGPIATTPLAEAVARSLTSLGLGPRVRPALA